MSIESEAGVGLNDIDISIENTDELNNDYPNNCLWIVITPSIADNC